MRASIVVLGALAACGRFGFDATSTTDEPEADIGDTVIEIDAFSTSSDTFTPIPDATLTIPPSASRWLLMTSATLQSDSLSPEAGPEIRYLLDGIELGLGGSQNSELDRPGPFQHFAVIDGKPVAQTVRFELRDLAGGTTRVEQLRAYAVPAAPAVYETADAIADVTSATFAPIATFDVGPGDYLFFGLVNASDNPGSSDCYTQWRAAGGQLPGREMQNPRGAWQSRIAIWRETVAAPSTIALEAHVSSDTSRVQYVRLLGYRTSDLVFDIATNPALVLTATEALVLELVPTIQAPRYLFIGSSRVAEDCDQNGVIAARQIEFAGATTSTISHVQGNCAFENSYGVVELLQERPAKLTTTIRSLNGEEVIAGDTTLLLLGL